MLIFKQRTYLIILLRKNGGFGLRTPINLLKNLNATQQRKLPENTPVGFISKKLKKKILEDEEIKRHDWECALYLTLKDEVKNSNFVIQGSKRFASIDTFFMPEEQWIAYRPGFFARANLPENPNDVKPWVKLQKRDKSELDPIQTLA